MAKLTLGPLLFNWSAGKRRDFYARIADEAPVDAVYLGEVVCAKRAPFSDPLLPDLIERLERAGKAVVLSTLGLVMSAHDREMVRRTCEVADRLIEANDLSAVHLLAGRPFTLGPLVNVYDEGTLGYLAGLGAIRACLPPELPLKAVRELAASRRRRSRCRFSAVYRSPSPPAARTLVPIISTRTAASLCAARIRMACRSRPWTTNHFSP